MRSVDSQRVLQSTGFTKLIKHAAVVAALMHKLRENTRHIYIQQSASLHPSDEYSVHPLRSQSFFVISSFQPFDIICSLLKTNVPY